MQVLKDLLELHTNIQDNAIEYSFSTVSYFIKKYSNVVLAHIYHFSSFSILKIGIRQMLFWV